MGESQRLTSNPQIGHVERFSDYVDDLQNFVLNIVEPRESDPLYLVAHSLGAMVSAELLARSNTKIKAAALSAPMFGINTRGIPKFLVDALLKFNIWRGNGAAYCLGAGDYDPFVDSAKESRVTHSLLRAELQLELYRSRPQIVLGGQRNQWLAQSLETTDRIRELAEKIQTPMLIYQAADEQIVSNAAQIDFCQHARNCKLVIANGSRHEVFQEVDGIRSPVLAEINAFFR